MPMDSLLEKIRSHPDSVTFAEVISAIDQNYRYTPTKFINGEIINEAGSNEGSCKIFAFAHLNGLSVEQTLNCFGDYYRSDVLGNPDGTDHANIRNFMEQGWDDIQYLGTPLTPLF